MSTRQLLKRADSALARARDLAAAYERLSRQCLAYGLLKPARRLHEIVARELLPPRTLDDIDALAELAEDLIDAQVTASNH